MIEIILIITLKVYLFIFIILYKIIFNKFKKSIFLFYSINIVLKIIYK